MVGFLGSALACLLTYHVTTLDRGQGLNHAIADAASYVAALRGVREGRGGLGDAVAGYEGEMVGRGAEEVRLSKLNTEMVHDWDRLVESPVFKMGGNRNV